MHDFSTHFETTLLCSNQDVPRHNEMQHLYFIPENVGRTHWNDKHTGQKNNSQDVLKPLSVFRSKLPQNNENKYICIFINR